MRSDSGLITIHSEADVIMRILKSELEGWKPWEICWMAVASLIITGLSIYWKDSLMGIISALTGVICVICTGKGKLSAYAFGLVNCVLYAIISYNSKLYGEAMLNAIYYVPMQFVGFFAWKNNINNETKEVKKLHMTVRIRIMWLIVIFATTVIYGYFLKYWGDAMPFVDSFTTVASVVAMIVSVKMYSEQWWIWIAVDVFSVIMWLKDYLSGNDNIATLLMWIVYLLNAVLMLIKWEKEANVLEVKNEV